jgi:hypothetical protein
MVSLQFLQFVLVAFFTNTAFGDDDELFRPNYRDLVNIHTLIKIKSNRPVYIYMILVKLYYMLLKYF